MHLTPGFVRMHSDWHRMTRQLLVTVLVSACAPSPVPTPTPEPVPAPVLPVPPVPPRIPVPRLVPDSAQYEVQSVVVTIEDSSSTSPRQDTVRVMETIQATLVERSTGSFELVVRSDSGYRTSEARQPPPETLRQEFAVLEAVVKLNRSRLVPQMSSDSVPACMTSASFVSPLSVLLFARYVQPGATPALEQDSISYRSCYAGVNREYMVKFTTVRTVERPFVTTIEGTLHSDSSRALPMRLTGQLNGFASALPANIEAPLPFTMTLDLTADLQAIAQAISTRHTQSFRQHIHTVFTRIDPR